MVLSPACTSIESHRRSIELESGVLTLNVTQADFPLEELCGFASRFNPKRGYLFVSKVLGKHYPVRPATMDAVYEKLAGKLSACDGPTVVIGMAETATALSHGVYEHLLKMTGHGELLFQHTTRYVLKRPLAFEFAEAHSHAPRHFLYEAAAIEHQQLFANASHLVLIDDEISTGATLANLIRAYRHVNSRLRSLQVVSLTNWQPLQEEEASRQVADIPTEFHSLLRGDFQFEPNPNFKPPALEAALPNGRFYDDVVPANFGRLGVQGKLFVPCEQTKLLTDLQPDDRVLVLGSGEFAYPPFLLARWLESHGMDVHFQTTTRSPILPGDDIASVISSTDNYHEEIQNFVYNVADQSYDRILLCYETPSLPASHDLPGQLNATTVFFEESKLRVG